MNVLDLMATLSLDNSKYLAGLAMSEGQAKGFGKRVTGVLGKLGKAAGVAMAAAGTATVAFGVSAVKTGMEFDKAMSQVAATMGLTMDDMKNEVGSVDLAWGKFSGNLREYAQEMGAHTAFTATQAAEALNYMALAGYKTQESMEMLPNVMNLAAAGSFDLATASDMLTDTQTALGLSFERTNQMVDEWAKAASTGNTSVQQLGDAFLVVGGLAKELNGGFVKLADGTKAPVDGVQEMEIALTAMANAGVKGSEAGTHMRNMLLKLSSPTSEGTKQLEALGVSVFDAEGKMRSLHDIFGDLNVALGDLTQEQKIQAISDLFNARDIASAEALLAAVESDWNGIGESILNADGAAQKMADTQLDNLAGDITLFQSALEGAQIALSDGLSPALRGFVQEGTNGLTEFTEKLQDGDFTGAAEAIGSALGDIAASVITKIPQLISVGLSLLKGLISSVASQLPTVLQQLYTTLMDGLTNMSSTISANFPEMLKNALTGLMDLSGTIRERFGELVDVGLEIIQSIADGIIQNIPTIIETVPTIISNIAGFINDNAPKLLAIGVQIIIALAKGLVQAIPTLLANIPQILKAIWDAFTAINWLALGGQLITAIGNGIKAFGESLPTTLSELGTKAWNAIKNIDWASVGTTIVEAIGKGITALVTLPAELLKTAASAGMKLFTGVAWGNVGRQTLTKIAKGMLAAISTVTSAIRSVVSKVKSFFPIKVGKIFGNIKIPKINVSGGKAPFGIGGKGTTPKISVAWNKKAEEVPYLFTNATLFGAGERNDEVLYGRTALMRDMKEAVSDSNRGGDIIINLNYSAGEDANELARDLARGINRYRMAGAI